MTKFDSILTDLCEANNYPAPGTQNQQTTVNQNQQPVKPVTGNTNTVTQNQTQQNKPGQPQAQNQNQTQQNKPAQPSTTGNQVKLTPEQTKSLMDDFNNNNVQVKNVADFKKYGISLS